jgi:predicted small metal-binding protein
VDLMRGKVRAMRLTMRCRTCGFIVSATSEAALASAYCDHAEYGQSMERLTEHAAPDTTNAQRAALREHA